MSEYEDLVELGFEGIDKFANKYHDTVYGYAGKRKKSLHLGGRRKGPKEGHGRDQHREQIHPQAEAPPPPPSPPHPPADLNAPIPPPPAAVPLPPPPPPPPPPPFQAVPQPYGSEWVPEDGGRDTRAMSDPRIRHPGPVPMPMPMPVPVPVAGPGVGPRGDFGMRDEPPAARGHAGNERLARSPPSSPPQPRERGFNGRGREFPRNDDDYYWEESWERRERDRPLPRRRRSPSWSPPRRLSAAEARYDESPPRRREGRSSSKKNKSRAKSKSPSRGAGTEATVAAVLAGGLVALGARGVVELYDRHQERKARDERAQRQRHRERRRSVW